MIFIFQAALCKVLLYWLILHLLIIFIYHQMGKWRRKYHHPNFKISKYKITLNACLTFILCFSCINQNCHFIEIKYYIHKTNFSPSTSMQVLVFLSKWNICFREYLQQLTMLCTISKGCALNTVSLVLWLKKMFTNQYGWRVNTIFVFI